MSICHNTAAFEDDSRYCRSYCRGIAAQGGNIEKGKKNASGIVIPDLVLGAKCSTVGQRIVSTDDSHPQTDGS